MNGSGLLCAIGMHRWKTEKNEDGESYRRCRRCGKDDANIPSLRGVPGADNQAWPR